MSNQDDWHNYCQHDWHDWGTREAEEGERPKRKTSHGEIFDYCRMVWCPHCGSVREGWMSGGITQRHLKFE